MGALVLTGVGVVFAASIAAYFLRCTGHVVVAFARSAWQIYGVRTSARPTRYAWPDPSETDEPLAHLPYPVQPIWADTMALLAATRRDAWQSLSNIHKHFWNWYNAAPPPIMVASLPLAVGLVVGTGLVAVPVTAGLVVLVAVPVAATTVWLLSLLLMLTTLGTVERVVRVVRRVVVVCPHPGCYRRLALPAYACPADGCDRRHPRLVPGVFGVLRHTCGCGARLPTLGLLGRHRLAAYCPVCRGGLPRRTGAARMEQVPVVGGPDAGKSTFLCLAVGALDQAMASHGGMIDFPDPREQDRWRTTLARLRDGVRLPKTPVEPPKAVMLDLRPRSGNGRILYFFDPGGEMYEAAELLDSQHYLDRTETALVVVDPLAIPLVRSNLTDQELSRIADAGLPVPGPLDREGPGDTIDRLLVVLRNRAKGGLLRRILPDGRLVRRTLVVVTKTDALRDTGVGAGLQAPDPDVEGWLVGVGWGNWTRVLRESCGEVRYLASGLDIDDATLVPELEWLAGTRLTATRPLDAGWYARLDRARRPWPATSRPELVPRSHAAGRLLMQALAVPLALLAAAAAPIALTWGLVSLAT